MATHDGYAGRVDDGDDNSETGLVRQASLGKKAKPNLVPVRSESLTARPDVAKGGIVAQAAMSAGAAGGAFAAGLGSRDVTRETTPQPSITSPTALADPSSSETSLSSMEKEAGPRGRTRADVVGSTEIFGDMKPIRTQSPVNRTGSPYAPKLSSPLSPNANVPVSRLNGARSPGNPAESAQMAAIMGGLEKGGALDKDTAAALKSPRSGFGDKAGVRRPPRLNVDAVRDAEARGSLTSLPDLIRRATRLAANLDRGKTASRLGMDWFLADAKKEDMDDLRKSGTGSLSDILASFPPPGVATPTGNRSPAGNRNNAWPTYNARDVTADDLDPRFVFEKPGERKRRKTCCGMPKWAFIILCIILFLLIVAAVVVPVTLIVIPREKNTKNAANTALAACQKSLPCENGGSSTITANGTCSCLCANGFSGSRCTTAGDSSCTKTSVGSTDATVGNAIPRLIDSSESNFSIPLDAEKVLSGFSAADLSCATQNALITLNGQSTSQRRSLNGLYVPLSFERNPFIPAHKKVTSPQPTALARRGDSSTATVNGVLVAASQSAAPSTAVDAASDASATVSAASATSTAATMASVSNTDSSADKDFARICILFVLQETGSFSDATDAQGVMSKWFGEADTTTGGNDALENARNISLGSSGWTMDLADLRVTTSNGTTYGAISTSNKGVKVDS